MNDIMGRSTFQPRDAGTRLVRQGLSLKDLSSFVSEPRRTGVDHVFVERKGEGSWTYVTDTDVIALHHVSSHAAHHQAWGQVC